MYTFAKGQIKNAGKFFPEGQYEIIFDPKSEIAQVEDDGMIPKLTYNPTPIAEIQLMDIDKVVDVVGVIFFNPTPIAEIQLMDIDKVVDVVGVIFLPLYPVGPFLLSKPI